jgi:hypothetical protein
MMSYNLPGRYRSPDVDSEDNRPRFKSYQEEFEHCVNCYYHWWAHRKNVTIDSILYILGLSEMKCPKKDLLSPYSIKWEAAMSALRMLGVDVKYDKNKRLKIIK